VKEEEETCSSKELEMDSKELVVVEICSSRELGMVVVETCSSRE